MSVSCIPEKTKIILWGKAAGRCQYEGCNELLYSDPLTKSEFNQSYITHIIADKPNGPRGDKFLSKKLEKDISNLMLMCDTHHRLIDKEDVKGHPVNRLKKMKEKHEKRIELLTSILEEKQSHIVIYCAVIGGHSTDISWQESANAMIPQYYPAEKQMIELGLKNTSFKDNEKQFWEIESTHLNRQFKDKIKERLKSEDINHLSIFAFGSIPLLIQFGHLLSDIPLCEVYQRQREPKPTWKWKKSPKYFEFILNKPKKRHTKIALNMSLSGTITNKRIIEILGPEIDIWTITIKNPNNDFIKSKKQLSIFRKEFRKLLNEIKSIYGQKNIINLFPAVPVSIAVEIGRVRMPKVDLAYKIYDQNDDKFNYALAIK